VQPDTGFWWIVPLANFCQKSIAWQRKAPDKKVPFNKLLKQVGFYESCFFCGVESKTSRGFWAKPS
jgi:hypothetical protein